MIEAFFTPDECHLTPTVAVCRGRCENPRCVGTHGWQLYGHWFWWGFTITWWLDGDNHRAEEDAA